MNRILKRISLPVALLIVLVGISCFMGVLINIRIGATKTGTAIGKDMGTIVGKAIGSFTGITEGREMGEMAGKAAGLSAEDTYVDIAAELRNVTNLEVLVASVKLNDMHSVGEDYAALYLLKGDAVFSVDLSKAIVEEREDGLYISVPSPTMELIFDQSKIQKVAEYQKHYFSGSTEAGLDAYLNTMKKIVEETEKSLSNRETLQASAEESARKQIEQLVNAVSLKKQAVQISFQEKEDSNGK